MRETLLLYNINDRKTRSVIQLTAVQMKIRVRIVSPSQYHMPLGLLAVGKEEDQKEYLTEAPAEFEDAMLVFAGLSVGRLNAFLSQMAKKRVPQIDLKASLTEHNAVWDSVTLHDELVKEHASMHGDGPAAPEEDTARETGTNPR